ncbi:hypothetical protein [Nioella sediminis]|uniref:hypothetical protein n=1 Tax=Nioella sediminis TaxID=1912092 RepID=UPI000A9C0726|nr:hypothetical protein [Nioella sediminis]
MTRAAPLRAFVDFTELEARYGSVGEVVELPDPCAVSARQGPHCIRAPLSTDCATAT